MSARLTALRHLQRVEQDAAYVARLAEADDEALDARDRRQVAHLVAGVTRLKRWLDYLLSHLYHGQVADLEPALRQVLRMGLYELLVLDTPPHAAVNEAVELARAAVNPGASKLVNAVLRAAVRRRADLPEPQTGDVVRDLGVRHSHPTWLVRRWVRRYGPDEAEALLRADNEVPVYSVRVNTLRTTPEAVQADLDAAGIAWEPSPYLDDFVRVPRLQPILQAGWLADGRVAVQDEAAALVVRLLDPQPGETIADPCAAPGGKALYSALRMGNRGRVWAYDLHVHKLGLVRDAATAHGLTILDCAAADLRDLARQPQPPQADRVLLDAPCSGLGVLAKRADLRWHRTEAQIAELTGLQDELLDAAARLVAPGGLLVYATCTTEPEENEHRIRAFLDRHADFTLEPATGFVPDAMVTPDGFYQALPHRHGTDGAFGARLRRSFAHPA